MNFFICLLFFLLSICKLPADDCEVFIKTLKSQERADLADFFKKVIFHDQFAYTLDSYKAMAVSGGFLYSHLIPYGKDVIQAPSPRRFWEGWKVWLKHQPNFKMQNFVLLEERSHQIESIKFIVIVNKQVFRKVVNEHLETFEKILKRKINAENLLQEISKFGYQKTLAGSEILKGILLGYGEHNSWLFEHREKFFDGKSPFHLVPSQKEKPLPIVKNPTFFQEDNPHLLLFYRTNFLADLSSSETQELRRKYNEAEKKIFKKYHPQNILHAVLPKLME
jgi:hypothetical protein